MAWTAPEVKRTDPPYAADERTMLDAWLDYHRETLLMKCAGLTGEALARRSAEPSTLSLLGLVRHMAEVERWWFRRFPGEPIGRLFSTRAEEDGDFLDTDPERAEQDFATYAEECELARRAAAGWSLDDVFSLPHRGEISVRWVYVHMIEEYARHNGHADLLRERVDGATGD